jgi:hypothetical protein
MGVDTKGLQAAYERKQAGTANKADLANLDYAFKKGLWSPGNLPKASYGPSSTKTEVKTLKGYDQGGKEVYVQPGQYYKGISATPITNIKEADDMINGNQEADYNLKAQEDAPKTRLDETKNLLDEYSSLFTGGKKKPETPSMEDTFTNLQKTYDTASLESEMADLNKEEKSIQARIRARKEYEASKPVAMGVISGKQAEIVRQENEELDRVKRDKSYLNDQLQSKYNMINTLMSLKQTDYTNAMNAYDKEFNQNIQTINFIRGIQNDAQTREDKQKSDALANLQIMTNAISSGSIDYSSMSPEQKSQINKNELLAGLPIGFTEMLQSRIPDKEIKATNIDYDSNGKEYATILTVDKKGKMETQTIYTGVKKPVSGSGVSDEEKERKQEVKSFQNDAAGWVEKLESKDEYGNLKYSWGAAYDSLKLKYPQFESLIDEALGGGYDEEKKAYYGRADR